MYGENEEKKRMDADHGGDAGVGDGDHNDAP